MFKGKIVNFKPHIVALDPFLKMRFQILSWLKIAVGQENCGKIAENWGNRVKIVDRNFALPLVSLNFGPYAAIIGGHIGTPHLLWEKSHRRP